MVSPRGPKGWKRLNPSETGSLSLLLLTPPPCRSFVLCKCSFHTSVVGRLPALLLMHCEKDLVPVSMPLTSYSSD